MQQATETKKSESVFSLRIKRRNESGSESSDSGEEESRGDTQVLMSNIQMSRRVFGGDGLPSNGQIKVQKNPEIVQKTEDEVYDQ